MVVVPQSNSPDIWGLGGCEPTYRIAIWSNTDRYLVYAISPRNRVAQRTRQFANGLYNRLRWRVRHDRSWCDIYGWLRFRLLRTLLTAFRKLFDVGLVFPFLGFGF